MWLDRLLDLLAPRECAACGVELSGGVFCRTCSETLSTEIESLSGLTVMTLGSYESAAGEAVRRLKYQRRPDLASPLGRRLGSEIENRLAGCHAIVPVPLHRDRLRQRGFNQSALLANSIARGTRNKVRHALARSSAGPDQAGSSRLERLVQARGRYVSNRTPPERTPVLLVDDVVTTGSTLVACKSALVAGGWTVSGAIALARAQIR